MYVYMDIETAVPANTEAALSIMCTPCTFVTHTHTHTHTHARCMVPSVVRAMVPFVHLCHPLLGRLVIS